MSPETITTVVVVASALLGVGAWIGLLVIPAWNAYSNVWQRLMASFLTLYVVAAMMGIGVVVGAGVVWFWDRL